MNQGLPNNIEAEKALLGSVFWSYGALQKACEEVDKDMLYNMIHNDYFEENFFANCKVDTIGEFLKEIIDAWEDELE